MFCCVFPTIFSVVSLLAGLGMVSAMPPFMVSVHDALHAWELPMIALSGGLLALGWWATWYSDKIDCHSTGCAHGACAPRKKRAHTVLKVATLLFVFNILIYTFIHRSHWFILETGAASRAQHAEEGHNH